ncbi:MAG: TolC family protein [Reichenbachiella sp.]
MRSTVKKIGIVILLFYYWESHSQQISDSILVLNDFYRLVKLNHPIAKQAILMNQKGDLTVKHARGSFDPKIVSEYNRKDFDGKTYFDLWDTYVQIPTLINVDLKAGYERNNGTYINPENTVPSDGLYYAGISVPLGRGLIHNQRNIGLKKSQYAQQAFENDANNVLNNLFLDANFAYWWWYENYQKREAMRNNLSLVIQKFEGVRQATLNGDKASIDSVEMLIQVQQWSNYLLEAELNLQNSILLLNNYLWSDSIKIENFTPTDSIRNQNINIEAYIDWAIVNHPQLKKLNIESNTLELDRKLTSESLKPIFDINYNLLLSGQEETQEAYFSNNYKLGFQFAFPLLIRKERAKLKIIKIKQQEYDLKVSQKNREIVNKISQGYNKVFTIKSMIDQQKTMQENYERMLQAEQSKFENGESSVFLLNSRENKKLQGEIKLIQLQAKYQRSIGELKWSTGKLYNEIQSQ